MRRSWKVRGSQGSREVEVLIKAPSWKAAQSASRIQGIAPQDIVLQELAGPARRKAIKAWKELMG